MSFLEALNKSKIKLKQTQTTITQCNGQKYIENKTGVRYERVLCETTSFGFVVDTKPDHTPVLIIPNLYLGSQDCAEENVLHKYKIKNVLSIGVDVFSKHSDCAYTFVECLDLPETNIVEKIRNECIPLIEKCLNQNESILVHCNAGCSRAPTIVIGYLMLKLNFSFADAFNLVKKSRPCIQPNAGFLVQLKQIKN